MAAYTLLRQRRPVTQWPTRSHAPRQLSYRSTSFYRDSYMATTMVHMLVNVGPEGPAARLEQVRAPWTTIAVGRAGGGRKGRWVGGMGWLDAFFVRVGES